MAEQQRVSVWPYVQWYMSNVHGFKFVVKNSGVGPAIIKSLDITVDGKPVEVGGLAQTIYVPPDGSYATSSVVGMVLPANEQVPAFQIEDEVEGKKFTEAYRSKKLTVSLTYCSIYGDCWNWSDGKSKRVANQELGFF